jgi:hypothetical protein
MLEEARQAAPQRRTYRWLTVGSLLTAFCGSAPSALYPLYQREWKLSTSAPTLVFAIFISGIICALLIAPISDRVGRFPILVTASAMSGLAALILLTGEEFRYLSAASFVQGLGVGLYQSTVNAALVELLPQGQYSQAAVASSRMGTVGLAAGPLGAGILAEYAPDPLHLIYAIELLSLCVLLVALLRTADAVKVRAPSHFAGPEQRRGDSPLISRALLLAVAFLAFASGSFLNAAASTVLVTWLGVNNLAIGGIAVALLFSSSALTQSRVTRHRPSAVMCVGLVVAASGLFLNAAALAVRSPELVLAAIVVIGSGQGGAYAGSLAQLNMMAQGLHLSATTGRYYLAAYVGAALSSLGGGWVFARFGESFGALLFACWIGVPAVIVVNLVRRTTRRR